MTVYIRRTGMPAGGKGVYVTQDLEQFMAEVREWAEAHSHKGWRGVQATLEIFDETIQGEPVPSYADILTETPW